MHVCCYIGPSHSCVIHTHAHIYKITKTTLPPKQIKHGLLNILLIAAISIIRLKGIHDIITQRRKAERCPSMVSKTQLFYNISIFLLFNCVYYYIIIYMYSVCKKWKEYMTWLMTISWKTMISTRMDNLCKKPNIPCFISLIIRNEQFWLD